MNKKPFVLKSGFAFLLTFTMASTFSQSFIQPDIDKKVDSVLRLMTLEEKIGQLNQLTGDFSTGAKFENVESLEKEIKTGRVGSFLNVDKIETKINYQKIAVNESRLKIPLMFAFDVIHGFKTIFPIPLAESGTFDLELVELSARISAIEASSYGINWTFSPMVDVARDPRWGRVMEGAGEDTWWGTKVAIAKVNGYQGKDLSLNNTILACAKHFAAYGTVESGSEYNTSDVSEAVMREVYLPPFKACADAGVATFMNGFTLYNRIPLSCNKPLVKGILREEWGYKGVVISDWASFKEVINHGAARDKYEAALKCMNATSDVDMEGFVYIKELANLVRDKKIKELQIDDAVRRILRLKFMLGLFDDPFRYLEVGRPSKFLLLPEHLKSTREIAKKSFVLLKNENNILPLSNSVKKIALIGYLANSKDYPDYIGNWSAYGNMENVVNMFDGIKNRFGNKANIIHSKGCSRDGATNDTLIAEALKSANESDVIILAIGENGKIGGEFQSRAHLDLPDGQKELVRSMLKTGKPVVCVVFANRPLCIDWLDKNAPAIMYVWQPGIEGGNAIADVIFGDYNPSGKLPITFPRSVGQIPVYYNRLNAGKNYDRSEANWNLNHRDEAESPLYPFGYGLSYTSFQYSDLKLDKKQISKNDSLQISVKISNTGKYDGEETAQLYLRDLFASVSRPVKELRGIKKIFLKSGESKVINFYIHESDLKFWNDELKYVSEAGDFEVFVGSNSEAVLKSTFSLMD